MLNGNNNAFWYSPVVKEFKWHKCVIVHLEELILSTEKKIQKIQKKIIGSNIS